jgi:hypothetical protein
MYAIRLSNQVIWTQNNKEILFNTEEEAEQALIEEVKECEKAFKLGYMEDSGDFDNYRIVKVN